MSNSLDPDQARRFVRPDLGPNCLPTGRLSAGDTDGQRVKRNKIKGASAVMQRCVVNTLIRYLLIRILTCRGARMRPLMCIFRGHTFYRKFGRKLIFVCIIKVNSFCTHRDGYVIILESSHDKTRARLKTLR